MENTLGEKRVKVDFNTDNNETVDKIKKKIAEVINLVEELRVETATGEKHRLISLSQTELESASMWAVKACYTE